MKPTERQRYLMSFAGGGLYASKFGEGGSHSFWRVTDAHPSETLGTSSLVRPYEYLNSDREPSRPELQKLLDLGWVEMRPDPECWTENTLAGKRRQHFRVWLTDAGRAVLGSD